MKKLKLIIEQHARWGDLWVYLERIEAYVETDFSFSLENSKALLETIGKEICHQKGIKLSNSLNINMILKKAFIALGHSNDGLVTQISGALANIAQQMGNLRNEIGLTSHGMSLENLKERNSKVDIFTRELLIDATEVVALFLIRGFEATLSVQDVANTSENTSEYKSNSDIYESNSNFNEFWDETFGEFTMGLYSYPASEILYKVDTQAYANEYKEFIAEAIDD